MTIINTNPDRIIQLGYEGEDRVTVLRFRYPYEWLSYGEGVFTVRVRRHGEHTAYNAQLVMDDRENTTLFMTVTNVELSVKGSGEMQVVYSGADFVKKSPIYSYNVSRAVDEVADPPAQDVYTQIIESLSDLQTDVQGLTDAVEGIGNLADLTTTAKNDLVSAINEVNSKSVDDVLSATSTNPVQNKVLTARINSLDSDVGTLRTSVQSKADIQTVSALADAVQNLDGDVQGLQTAVQAKADTATVTALSGTVSGLQTAVQSKADAQTVTALSGTVTDLQTSKADIQTVSALADAVQNLDGDVQGLQTTVQEKADADAVSSLIEQIYNAYPNVEAETASVVSITDGADGIPVKSLIVGIEPVQDLHGYDSPWPAGGGKNLINIPDGTQTVNGVTATAKDGIVTLSGTATARAVIVLLRNISIPAGTYRLNGAQQTMPVSMYMNFSPGNASAISETNGILDPEFTLTEPTSGDQLAYLRLDIASGINTNGMVFKPMIRKSTESATFATYSNICPITGWTGAVISHSGADMTNPTIYPVTFPTEAGTVYGGSLDVTNGTLTVDRAMTVYDGTGNAWFKDATYNYFRTRTIISDAIYANASENTFKSNLFPYGNIANTTPTTGACLIWGTIRVRLADMTKTIDEFNAMLSETPLQVVYRLATPITYQLTPTEVTTLLGSNNIWADTGDTSLAYRADTKLYVDGICADCNSMLAPVESTYIATRNYTTGKLLIVDNTLYKVTANIANGGTITAGTNVVATTLSEVIASLS